MRKKIHLLALSSVIAFLLGSENVKAENNRPFIDSTCCAPDSLTLVSVNYSTFCIGWKVASDSACRTPQGFEVQWKLLTASTWHSQTVIYTLGTVVNFCVPIDTCGSFQWRVRTKCNDSTYSGWIKGKTFVISCNGGSSCCPPGNLTVISTNYPGFCVRWEAPTDTTCYRPQAFEVQWKLLTATIWHSQTVTYTSGTIINFCDSVDTCGSFQWRVRSKCNGRSFSDWVYGKKFVMSCDSIHQRRVQHLSISPNPGSASIVITVRNIKQGPVKIIVADIAGRVFKEKTVYVRNDKQLMENLSAGSWQKGIYFISILSDGAVISRGSFLKE
jgi:hypothetical protein